MEVKVFRSTYLSDLESEGSAVRKFLREDGKSITIRKIEHMVSDRAFIIYYDPVIGNGQNKKPVSRFEDLD